MTVRQTMRRGKRRWVIDIAYKTADGRQERYRQDAQVQTSAAAHAEHGRLLRELGERGTLEPIVTAIPEDSVTFAEAVAHYRRTHAITRLKHSTRKRNYYVIDTMLSPRFERKTLREIDFAAVTEMDAELASNGLKPATRANVQIVLRSVLRCAAESGLLSEMPRLPKLPKVGKTVLLAMHPDELTALFEASNDTAKVAFALAAYAGLRAGEVRGLRWSDVDLKRGIITVRRSVVDRVEDTPKSGNGRTVPIAPPLRPYLEAAFQRKTSPWSEVAVTAQGKPWANFGLNQAFQRALERANLKGWSFHSLRHFFVTELCRRGAPTMVVKQLAGHAELSTTERYAYMASCDLTAAIALFRD
jgi:integrase